MAWVGGGLREMRPMLRFEIHILEIQVERQRNAGRQNAGDDNNSDVFVFHKNDLTPSSATPNGRTGSGVM